MASSGSAARTELELLAVYRLALEHDLPRLGRLLNGLERHQDVLVGLRMRGQLSDRLELAVARDRGVDEAEQRRFAARGREPHRIRVVLAGCGKTLRTHHDRSPR